MSRLDAFRSSSCSMTWLAASKLPRHVRQPSAGTLDRCSTGVTKGSPAPWRRCPRWSPAPTGRGSHRVAPSAWRSAPGSRDVASHHQAARHARRHPAPRRRRRSPVHRAPLVRTMATPLSSTRVMSLLAPARSRRAPRWRRAQGQAVVTDNFRSLSLHVRISWDAERPAMSSMCRLAPASGTQRRRPPAANAILAAGQPRVFAIARRAADRSADFCGDERRLRGLLRVKCAPRNMFSAR